MKQSSLIKLVDLLSFLTLLVMISTGALLEFTLQPRSGSAAVWGMTRHEWGDLHSQVSLAFLILLAAHLVLHFRYIASVVAGKASREQVYRVTIGVVAVVILLLLAIAPVLAPVEDASPARPGYQYKR